MAAAWLPDADGNPVRLDPRPAAARGVTILQAAGTWGVPLSAMRRAYVGGAPRQRIGRRDQWDVWFCERETLVEHFGEPGARSAAVAKQYARAREAVLPSSAQAAAQRLRTMRGET